jgi:TPR repeat protein
MMTPKEQAFRRAEANFNAKNYQDAYLQLLPLGHEGDARAQYILGRMSDNGLGLVQLDVTEAARWYRAAADKNHPDAQFAMANAYATGRGVPLDANQSVQWLYKAANNGHRPAILSLAGLLDVGIGGIKQDLAEAASWIKRAADTGSVDALYLYAQRLELGLGVDKNEREAAEWYKRAADRGQAAAQLWLGTIADGSASSPERNIEAYMWLTLATQRGTGKVRTDAQQKQRDLQKNMMPSEVTEAQTRARAWVRAPQGQGLQPDPVYDGAAATNAPAGAGTAQGG